MTEGERYRFTAKGKWRDASTECDATGYDSAKLRSFVGLRRVKGAKWFSLIGAVEKEKSSCFDIGKHPDTLSSLNNLAVTFRAMGDQQGARKLQEQVLEHCRNLLGLEHPLTTISASNLLATYIEQDETSAARTLFEQDLKWLLADGLELHDARQKKIRDMLLAARKVKVRWACS